MMTFFIWAKQKTYRGYTQKCKIVKMLIKIIDAEGWNNVATEKIGIPNLVILRVRDFCLNF
jgi:hypothetical protein